MVILKRCLGTFYSFCVNTICHLALLVSVIQSLTARRCTHARYDLNIALHVDVVI